MKPRARRVRLLLTLRELNDMSRFLGLAVDCVEKHINPQGYRMGCWYYVKPLLKQIAAAKRRARS